MASVDRDFASDIHSNLELDDKVKAHPLNPGDVESWPSVVVFSDWDGTITTYDSNDYLTDNLGFGIEKRREGNLEILSGRVSFRDEFRKMLGSVSDNGHTLDDCRRFLTSPESAVQLDPGFTRFREWCDSQAIPFVILSSGMAPIIRAVLTHLAGEDVVRNTEIIANDVEVFPDGRWQIVYRHPDSPYGHDKSLAILPWRQRKKPPLLIFFGDGVSDLSAARHADLLFVKRFVGGSPSNLATYCARERIPHVLIDDFGDSLDVVEAVMRGNRTVADVTGSGVAN